MTTLNNVVLFVLVLFVLSVGSVVPADAQSRAERNAYAGMDRAVQSAQANPTADRIAAAQRAIRSAYNVFLRQERNRDQAWQAHDRARTMANDAYQTAKETAPNAPSATKVSVVRRVYSTYISAMQASMRYAELLAQSTAPFRAVDVSMRQLRRQLRAETLRGSWTDSVEAEIESSNRAHTQVLNTHGRYLHAAMDSIRDAAEAIARLDPSILGTRHNDLRLRFENANMATLRQLGVVLQARSGNWESWDQSAYDTALSNLVDSATAVADAMASRQRESVADQQAFIEAERRREQEQQTAGQQQQQQQAQSAQGPRQERAEREQERQQESPVAAWQRFISERMAEAERRVSDLANITCGGFSSVTWARIATSNAFNALNGWSFNQVLMDSEIVNQYDRDAHFARLEQLRDETESHARRIDPVCRR